MEFDLNCDKCGVLLTATDDLQGQSIICPSCNLTITIPNNIIPEKNKLNSNSKKIFFISNKRKTRSPNDIWLKKIRRVKIKPQVDLSAVEDDFRSRQISNHKQRQEFRNDEPAKQESKASPIFPIIIIILILYFCSEIGIFSEDQRVVNAVKSRYGCGNNEANDLLNSYKAILKITGGNKTLAPWAMEINAHGLTHDADKLINADVLKFLP